VKTTITRLGLVLVFLLVLVPPAGAAPSLANLTPLGGILEGCVGGNLPSQARIALCVPENWNGSLILYAHGYVGPGGVPKIPLEQLELDGVGSPKLVGDLGYAFAVTSYRRNGLAVRDGVADLLDLLEAFQRYAVETGRPEADRVYVVGVSEGGLIATLAAEQHPDVFSGALACCGPVGDFKRQMALFGDFRVVFDYFYPDILLPYGGDAFHVPDELVRDAPQIIARGREALTERTEITRQLIDVTKLIIDDQDPDTIASSFTEVIVYSLYSTNDAIEVLGGIPYNNTQPYWRYYGSDDDIRLNREIARFQADPAALAMMDSSAFSTNGRLAVPLVTLHTTRDPVVPYWHMLLYQLKTLGSGSWYNHTNIAIDRYGHCYFTAAEVVFAFGMLVFQATGTWPQITDETLPTAELRDEYAALQRRYLPSRIPVLLNRTQ